MMQRREAAEALLWFFSSRTASSDKLSLAQKLKMEGREEGRAEGEAEGIWKGQLMLLEKIMGRPATPESVFSGLNAAQLKLRFKELEAEYNSQFKQA